MPITGYQLHTILIIIFVHLQYHIKFLVPDILTSLVMALTKAGCMGGRSSHKNSCVHRQMICISNLSALELPVEQIAQDTTEGIMNHPLRTQPQSSKLGSLGCVVMYALFTMHTKFVRCIWVSIVARVGGSISDHVFRPVQLPSKLREVFLDHWQTRRGTQNVPVTALPKEDFHESEQSPNLWKAPMIGSVGPNFKYSVIHLFFVAPKNLLPQSSPVKLCTPMRPLHFWVLMLLTLPTTVHQSVWTCCSFLYVILMWSKVSNIHVLRGQIGGPIYISVGRGNNNMFDCTVLDAVKNMKGESVSQLYPSRG